MPADRDVIVPLSLYKTVVVFSTLIATIGVVGGFMVLDVATQRATAPPGEVDPGLTLLGIGLIAGGAAVFAFGARFRAPGMRTDKDEESEPANNG